MNNNLEKITSKILAEANEYAMHVKTNAKVQADAIINEAIRKAAKETAEIASKNTKECDAIISRATSSADILNKNILIDAKSTIVDSVFSKAEESFNKLDSETYFNFLVKLLNEAIKMIPAEEDDGFGYTQQNPNTFYLTLNKKDNLSIGNNLIEAVKANVVKIKCTIALNSTYADIKGGFILRRGDIEINASSDMIFKDAREKYEGNVLTMLFD